MMISKVCEDSCLSHKVMSWNYLTDMMPLIIFEMCRMPTESLNKPQINRIFLTLSWRRSLSYRNKSIDLLCKPMDWFLYDLDLHNERVIEENTPCHLCWISSSFSLTNVLFTLQGRIQNSVKHPRRSFLLKKP